MTLTATRSLVAACVLLGACSFETGGGGGTDGGSEGSSGATAEASTTSDDPTSGQSATSAASKASDSDSDSDSNPTSGSPPDESSSGVGEADADSDDPPPSPDLHSCADILAANPQSPSGPYPIADQFGATLRVHCDMEIDGGGWTLVGRSVEGDFDQGNFGWSQRRGAVTEPDAPYSLGVFEAGIEFDQLLVGDWSTGYQWGDHVYRVDVGPGFLQHTDDAVGTVVTTVAGDCSPNGGPAMFQFAGHTGNTSRFWFRDSSDFEPFGLAADDFNLYWSAIYTCTQAGDLSGDPGMLFVR